MKTNPMLAGLLAALILAAGWYGIQANRGDEVTRSPADAANQPADAPQITAGQAMPAAIARDDADLLEVEWAARLLEQYGTTIGDPRVQIELMDVQSQLLRDNPQDGLAQFARIVRLAFPELADEILTRIANMIVYEEWLAENQPRLNDLNLLERQGLIWEKRKALFGESAELIWKEEVNQWAERRQKVQARFEEISQSPHIPLDEAVYQLRTAVEETYGDIASQLTTPSMLGQVLFEMQTVQQRLKQLPPDERQAALDDLRRQLGYSEERVAQLSEQDQERNMRWEKGLAYMRQRDQLAASLEGSDLETALAELRQETFGREAYTIEKEEESGFFRYNRPRVYGRN